MTRVRPIRWLVAGVLLAAGARMSVAASGQASIAYLAFGPLYHSTPDEQHLEHAKEAGLTPDVVEAKNLSWDRLRRYNVVVVYHMPHPDEGRWPAEFEAIPALLTRFVNAGGGLFSAGLCASHGQNQVHNDLLRPFEMTAPYERIVESDPARIYKMPSMFGHRFMLTTEIAPGHPVTAGVRALWSYFPNDGKTLGEFPHPLVPQSDAWTVIVWGSPTSRSVRMPNFGEATDETSEPAVTYAQRPPLMAVRDLGKGRVAVTVMNQSHLIFNGWHFAYDGIALATGDGSTPSAWETLLLNTYRWLAAPSLESGSLGGFQPVQDVQGKAQAEYDKAVRVGFDRTVFGPPSGTHFKGLIGARTAYSVGSGTVADYVAAAKAADYAWIVFAEHYEEMTEAAWGQLAADCKRATSLTGADDDFWAIPGIEYPDQCGNRFISFGPGMGWLKPEWLERKRFGANEDMNVNYRFPDTILFELRNNKLDPHYIGHYYSLAIETYRGAEQTCTSNELAQYARLQYLRYNLHPTAIHFVDEPSHIATAAATGFQNFLCETALSNLLARITGPTSRYCHINHPVPLYISEGPRISAWQGSRTGLGARDRFIGGEPIQHWEVRLAAEGDQPIQEVRLANGPFLLRRQRPNTPSFDQVYHGFHDRQHNLFATVVDQAGRRAVTSCLITLTLRNHLVNCTDNRNIILGGQYGHSRQPPRGFEMYFQRVYLGCLAPGWPLLQNVREPLQPLNPIDDRHEYFASKDIVILDEPLLATWPPGLVAHGGKTNGYPEADDLAVEDFDCRRRTYRLTTGKDNPELLLVETAVTFKRELHLSDGVHLDLSVARVGSRQSVPTDFQALAKGDARRMDIRRRFRDGLSWSGDVSPGEYVAAVPVLTGAAAIMPLDQPMLWWGECHEKRAQLRAGIDLPSVVRPGDRFAARYVYAVGRFGEPIDSPQFADIIEQLGLAGEVPYTVETDAGKVVDTTLLLTVAADGGAFSAKVSQAALPVDGLTVKVEGVNNNWSAGIYGRDNGILSRIGGRDGVVWANIDISRDRDLFIGNLLTCDAAELILIFLEGDDKGCTFQAHNPTDAAIVTTVRSHPRFTRIRPVAREVRVPSGSTVEVRNDTP